MLVKSIGRNKLRNCKKPVLGDMSRQQGLTRHDSEVSGAHFARGRVEQGCNHPVFTVNRQKSLDAEDEDAGAKKKRRSTNGHKRPYYLP